ncbi:MAG: sn-glycerol-3-phosphate ABC transporter ATP-binding protein UgpC [Devosia sp.]
MNDIAQFGSPGGVAAASLQLRGIRKTFGEIEVVHGVDLDIAPGEFVVFVGPSGCGKSTLLRMIAGLEPISAGDLTISGERMNGVSPAKRGIAMVFQSYALYPHMSVYQNLAFALETARQPKAEIERRVRSAAGILQIESLLKRKPKQLSGGQRQRVAIGRAIVREPVLFLFDEPLSNLDAELRVQMRVEIARLHKQLGTTMIYVTHDQVEAMTMADKIVVLHDGRIEQAGAPLELYNAPSNRFVAGFLGSPKMNFLKPSEADDAGVVIDGERLALPAIARPAGPIHELGVRPEHISVSSAEGLAPFLSLRVDLIENLGGQTVIYAATQAGQPVTIAVEGQRRIDPGTTVQTFVKPELCHLFDAEGNSLR